MGVVITAMGACDPTRRYYTTKLNSYPREVREKNVQWGGGFIEKSSVKRKGETTTTEAAARNGGQLDKKKTRVMFPPQRHDSLLALLTSFPHCMGNVVFDLPRLAEIGALGVLGAKLKPFDRPSSPCSSGHSYITSNATTAEEDFHLGRTLTLTGGGVST